MSFLQTNQLSEIVQKNEFSVEQSCCITEFLLTLSCKLKNLVKPCQRSRGRNKKSDPIINPMKSKKLISNPKATHSLRFIQRNMPQWRVCQADASVMDNASRPNTCRASRQSGSKRRSQNGDVFRYHWDIFLCFVLKYERKTSKLAHRDYISLCIGRRQRMKTCVC